jgi:hypothetical protein
LEIGVCLKLLSVVKLITAIPLEHQPPQSLFQQCKNTVKSLKNQLKGSQPVQLNIQAESSAGPHQSVEDTPQRVSSKKSTRSYSKCTIRLLKSTIFLKNVLWPVGYNKQCTICQYDLKKSQETKPFSPCKHRFHKDCIQEWTKIWENTTCPNCNTMNPASLARQT